MHFQLCNNIKICILIRLQNICVRVLLRTFTPFTKVLNLFCITVFKIVSQFTVLNY